MIKDSIEKEKIPTNNYPSSMCNNIHAMTAVQKTGIKVNAGNLLKSRIVQSPVW